MEYEIGDQVEVVKKEKTWRIQIMQQKSLTRQMEDIGFGVRLG